MAFPDLQTRIRMSKSRNQQTESNNILRPKGRNPKIEFDRLQMFFCEPYVINLESTEGQLTLYQPKIGDVIRIGSKRFFQTVSIFTTNTTQNRLMLWENNIDWNVFSDFDLFRSMVPMIDPEVGQLFLRDIDLRAFEPYKKHTEDKDCVVLYDKDNNIEIDENVYFHISQYIRALFNINPEEKITDDPILKKWYIDKDKRQLVIDAEKKSKGKTEEDSSMVSMISAYVNHPGTKYKTSELREVGVYEFYDALQRLQIYEQSTALLKGAMSGFVDSSKIKQEEMNFMRDI